MLEYLSPMNTIPMLGLLLRVRAPETPEKPKLGARAQSARTFSISEHDSDARIRYSSLY